MTTNVYANVDILLGTIGTAVTITDITNASPGALTHSGTDPSDGDYVLLTATGMTQVNNRVVRVTNQAVGSFDLEDVDTTLFGDFVSGTFAPITFGTSFNTISGVDSGGGEPEYADASIVHSDLRSEVPTVSSNVTLDLESLFDPGNTALQAAKVASDAKAARAIRVDWPSGAKLCFYGFVNAPGLPTGAIFEVVKTNVNIRGNGVPQLYTS